ncbi:MAG TPA: RNA polymerase sigma factor [Anaerolineae bacterium]|nr:RNA polymerase sigma factor [Anaerolineae bacterium]
MIYSKRNLTKKQKLTDNQLVEFAQNNDNEAFTVLYERYLPIVYRHVKRAIPEADVEDMTQEIFIQTLKSLPKFRRQAKFSTWLYTLTRRRIADYYRHRGKQQELKNVALAHVAQQRDPNATINEDSWLIREMLSTLPEHYQEVILLRFAEGLPFNEIAKKQGNSLDATKSLFRRAITALRDKLGEDNV